jgi:hypothetical protein
MKIRLIFTSLITAATLAACSSPTNLNLEDVGAQPTLEELNADNDSSLELAGKPVGLGHLLVRKIYDVNQNGKYDTGDQGIPDWGVRIVSVDENGNPDDAADVQVTPWGSGRWRGVNLKVPFGRYKIEELEPSATQLQGTGWKVTGKPARIVNVSRSNPLRAIEFAGVCLENGAVVPFPKLEDFRDWKCKAFFKLFPRIDAFTATPDIIAVGASTTLSWNVLDYSKLEITPLVGTVTGFKASKVVSPTTETVYQLKATNGFGTSTANVRVKLGIATGGWSTVGNLKFAAGASTVIPLGSDRFIVGNKELYDFKTGSSKELTQVPVDFTSAYYRLVRSSDQKMLTLFTTTSNQTQLNVYDPNTDTSSNTNLTNGFFGLVPQGQLQGDTFLATSIADRSSKISLGLLDLSTATYSKTADVQVVFDNPGNPIATAFVGMTKEKNALFVSVQTTIIGTASFTDAQAVIVNPRSGQVLSSQKMPEPFCFFSSASDFGTATFGRGVLLNNGHLLRTGGLTFRGAGTDDFCEYNPVSNTTTSSRANQLSKGTTFVLSNGKALVMRESAEAVSSNNPFDFDDRADLYDPNSQTFTFTSAFQQPRRGSISAQLADGRVVIFGGAKPRSPLEPSTTPPVLLSSIEVYTP